MMAKNSTIGIPSGKFVAVESRRLPIAQLNYIILKHLAGDIKAYVLYVAVGRPHHYMTHLLSIHGISQRGITYVDINKGVNLRFPIPIQSKEVSIGGFLRRDYITLQDYEYVIIDNVEQLFHLWTPEKLMDFFSQLKQTAGEYNVGIVLPLRNGKSAECERIKDLCDEIINMDEVIE